ncbi:hypothetical protein BAUCODRAFT_499054 [Baudoinia panamericana UAMH 10762]|uniref:C2H2-type domain-containing protein n=1 Tax=Baudoinia panamericana (strain UAMH 10762) TaxID=717646 RepID=M2N9B2_BAUPA|nr:uncharacterized protein BAUCODRAFT_499054 [Baudoinia panamericana UAMH 10762]EMC95689.1 hypothetical protein BAUCODRAFT_499054 [Baudoinia panamericana UAMH 10762]
MLATNSSSSIQKRRQLHRRQQSLEVPILATPLPANNRRHPTAHQGHRRGLSLDQSLSAVSSSNGFRPPPPQDPTDFTPPGPPSVRILLDTTDLPNQQLQQYVQETQQQPAQPGYYPANDFQSHLQQQLNHNFDAAIDVKPVIASPRPQSAHQQVALQELQNHMAWYSAVYGLSPNANSSTTPFFEASQAGGAVMPGAPVPMPVMQSMSGMPQTPLSYGHARLWDGCDRKFGRKENIRSHVQTHLGDRQFKCDLCDKTFVRQHDLKRHIAIHSDERPHECICGMGFARHDALTRHRQRGVCVGALPGYEKTEEEKPKRGRPKTNRRFRSSTPALALAQVTVRLRRKATMRTSTSPLSST